MIILFSTMWFWILFLELCVLMACVHYETGIGATVSVVASALCLWWLAEVPIFSYIRENPLQLLSYMGVYALVGTIWATGKWVLHLYDRRTEVRGWKRDFMDKNNIKDFKKMTADQKKEWKNGYAGDKSAPLARRHKSKLLFWMSYWPASMLWTALDDFVTRFFKAIYNLITDRLQSISDKMFAEFKVDEEDS